MKKVNKKNQGSDFFNQEIFNNNIDESLIEKILKESEDFDFELSKKTLKEIHAAAKALNTTPQRLIERIWKSWKKHYEQKSANRPLKPEEYKIMEALIAHEYQRGSAFYLNRLMDDFLEYYALNSEFSEDQNYLKANRKPLPLINLEELNLQGYKPRPVQLGTFHGEPGSIYFRGQSELEAFLLKEPVLKGAITFSRPGINEDQNRALISFQKALKSKKRHQDISLQEWAAFLEKNQDEVWQVIQVKKVGDAFKARRGF